MNNEIMEQLTGLTVYERSVVQEDSATYFLARSDEDGAKFMGVVGNVMGFDGERQGKALLCSLMFPFSLPVQSPGAAWVVTSEARAIHC